MLKPGVFILLLFVVAFGVPCLAYLYVWLSCFGLWVEIRANGLPITVLDMLFMRLRRVSPDYIVHNLISLSHAGVDASPGDLEAHVLAGGDLQAVIDAVIAADKADLGVGFREVAAIDLAGRDVVDAVNTSVRPKVLLCPPANDPAKVISGVSKDGIRLGATARVTVRTQLSRLVGGAGEDTIVARVGEGIVAAMGGAPSHRDILERPETISEHLLAKGLDSGTCFEIVSVDIGDVDVLDNVAARLSSARAEADKRVAQANAEVRRAAAVAAHHEMTARTTEMEGKVVSAKADVPLALASAVAETNIGRSKPLRPTVNNRVRWRLQH